MQQTPHSSTPIFKEILLRFFFQVLPTIAVALYILWMANLQFTLLRGQHIPQVIAFGSGLLFATLLYHTRIRFLPTFIALIILGWLIAQGLRVFMSGDIEPFFIAHQFYVYFVVFCIGWIAGFGLKRLRLGPTVVAVVMVAASIYLSSLLPTTIADYPFSLLLLYLIPAVLYGIYIIFISEQLRDYAVAGNIKTRRLIGRTILFLSLAGLCAYIVLTIFSGAIKTVLDNIQKGTYKDQSSMLQKNEDGSSIKNNTSMSGNNNRNKELLMLAYIDNYFEHTNVPNPLYMVTFYYALFDTATETFMETDDMPDKDLYRPDVSQIPLYQSASDSSVLAFGKGNKLTRTVDIEVYNKGLTTATFVAPSTAFFVQPIVVEKEFQSEYKSAYRAKSVISDLNSAYFVYNVNNPEIKAFQENRLQILQTVKGFSEMDSTVFAYYTAMPDIESLEPVRALAAKIAVGKETPIDKVIAVRDYFLSKNDKGKPLFKYTDNPGIPDIPSASKLNYFLFENRQGYCAHYAGATLFLLRSMGIPSRITAGFLTEDRSTSNPGWYYFYADQVHAWVQVYFPGYGWLDFDTTIGNEEAKESEQTDATPPLQPSKASLAISGYVLSVDTALKQLTIASNSAMALDKNYKSVENASIHLDISIARIIKDTNSLSIQNIQVGDTITAITYGKDIVSKPPASLEMPSLVKVLPNPVPVDHIQLRAYQQPHPTPPPGNESTARPFWKWMVALSGIALLILLLLQLIPRFIKGYYSVQSKNGAFKKRVYYHYVLSLYYLWMMRVRKKEQETSLQFAKRVDEKYEVNFAVFMDMYLKLKYSTSDLSENEKEILINFAAPFIQQMSKHFNKKERNLRWLHVKNALQFAWLKKAL